ncbi:MAG: SUMF1/EgtB/PvdO family nonheme iron enzyme [Bacteroidetes bacterium]|nr:SUMF1/EgtB/PvdO family nonheme iron enzyme [Bacteroidota bacterium]
MKKLLFISMLIAVVLTGCNYGNGELTGVPNREDWYVNPPFGMVFIKMGSYNMGPNDQDVAWAMTANQKTVSIFPFWMDETEITNNEYRQFVFWVRDSIAFKLMGAQDEEYLITENEFGEEVNPPYINWPEFGGQRLMWDADVEREVLLEMYLPEHERFYRRKEIDTRKLNFEYFWIDLDQAAKKFEFSGKYGMESRRSFDYNEMELNNNKKYDGDVINFSIGKEGQREQVKDRSSYIMRDVINVYPDTLCWISDFTYSYNEPQTKMYFWHPAYDHYPVVGVSWKQARAFSIWRTQLYNGFRRYNAEYFVQDWRLPTESEWEYAARGGLKESMYPWGGYYATNYKGCYIANFKPLRGNYIPDGGFYPLIVANNEPNEWGLYDMAGNVAEWTSNSFDESAYAWTDDLNPDYHYEALPDDLPVKKRKVIRGGSWKDIAYYIQCGTRTYEYQDSAKSYIGFRCVRTYLGRDANDAGSGSLVY